MPVQLIAFSNHKGGTCMPLGSMSLAGALIRGCSVLGFDADELRTATKGCSGADDFQPVRSPSGRPAHTPLLEQNHRPSENQAGKDGTCP